MLSITYMNASLLPHVKDTEISLYITLNSLLDYCLYFLMFSPNVSQLLLTSLFNKRDSSQLPIHVMPVIPIVHVSLTFLFANSSHRTETSSSQHTVKCLNCEAFFSIRYFSLLNICYNSNGPHIISIISFVFLFFCYHLHHLLHTFLRSLLIFIFPLCPPSLYFPLSNPFFPFDSFPILSPIPPKGLPFHWAEGVYWACNYLLPIILFSKLLPQGSKAQQFSSQRQGYRSDLNPLPPEFFFRRFSGHKDRLFSSTDSYSRRSYEIFLMIPSEIKI